MFSQTFLKNIKKMFLHIWATCATNDDDDDDDNKQHNHRVKDVDLVTVGPKKFREQVI